MTDHRFDARIPCIVMDPTDHVVTLLRDVKAGETLTYEVEGKQGSFTVKEDAKFGHKLALRPIRKGETILKYGEPIGTANRAIGQGEHVHVHNLDGVRGRGDDQEENRRTS